MNDFKKIIIQKHEKQIYSDIINPEDIVIYLLSKSIISNQDQAVITNSHNKTAELIRLLLHKSDGPWFEEFINAVAVDYYWISDRLKRDYDKKNDEKLTYFLRNVPPLTQHNVTRQILVQDLRMKLRELKRNRFLVVHGMSGFGKTCLVVDSLQDINLLEECFKGHVYWLTVGNLNCEKLDKLQCYELQKKLCDMLNLSINPQQDIFIQLRNHFSLTPYSSALIVLDKVRSPCVVEALNVGCKVLVTTQDCDVVKAKEKLILSVNSGFSESESVKLLQDFVFDGQGNLPPSIRDSAIKIHCAWKGHPMIIGLIGGELSESKEEAQKQLSRWQAYERSHLSEESNPRRRSIINEQISSIIALTTDKLQVFMKNRFEMLAVFVENTNITTDGLQILWELNEYNAQVTIDFFYKRSLVFRKYNNNLEKPVYGIHDILMEHLKKNISESVLQAMHQELVRKYFKACNGDFANLPQDNYIYSYLCHHIEHAKKWNEYRDQFFSLKFIDAKLKATGPGDLLLDFHKYYSGLVGDCVEYYSNKVEDIKKFVKNCGWDINRGEVDVIQCALLQDENSFIYQQGVVLAGQSSSSKIFFSPSHTWEKPKDLEIQVHNVTAVSIISNTSAFHANGRILLCSHEEGYIVEWDLYYRQKRRSFKESSSVVMLKISPSCDKFLSAMSNGNISIWNLTSENANNADTPPPSLRQKNYLSNFPETRLIPSLSFHHERPVTWASFSSDGKLVVSASQDGTVVVWNLEENKKEISFEMQPNPYAVACSFVCDDQVVVCGSTNFVLFFYHLKSKNTVLKNLDKNYGGLVSLMCGTDESRELIVVQEKAVKLFYWKYETLPHRREGPRSFELGGFHERLLYRESFQKNNKIFTAAYHSKHRLLLGTSDGCLIFFDIFNKNCLPVRYGSGEIKAVDIFDDRIVFAQLDLVKMSWPEPGRKQEPALQLISTHLGWTSRDVSVYTTAATDGAIKVYHDSKLVSESYHEKPCIVRVSTHGNHVLIGTLNGEVLLYDTISKRVEYLQSHFISEIKYLTTALYKSTPVYLAVGQENVPYPSYTLQAVMHGNAERQCRGLTATVVKTFICSQRPWLIAVLCDYSILMWDFHDGSDHFCAVQEGRASAKITDACLSNNEDVVVLTDKENCFHVFKLIWPHTANGNIESDRFNRIVKPAKLILEVIHDHIVPPSSEETDEIDGIQMSVEPGNMPKVEPITQYLPSPSWCCCICSKDNLIAIGYDVSFVQVWNLKKRKALLSFSVLPGRRSKVRHLQFAPYDLKYGKKQYKLLLSIVTDCLSLWDISPYVNDNSTPLVKNPECVGCVSAGGNTINEFSISPSFMKFAASDETGMFFLWKVWNESDKNTAQLASNFINNACEKN